MTLSQVLLDDARPAMGVKLTVLINPSARNTFVLTDVLDLELGAFMEFDDRSTLTAVLNTPMSKTRTLHARRVGGGVVTLWMGGGAEYSPQMHSNDAEGVGANTGVKIVVETGIKWSCISESKCSSILSLPQQLV